MTSYSNSNFCRLKTASTRLKTRVALAVWLLINTHKQTTMTITGGSGSEENIDFLEDENTTPEADLCKYPTIIQSSIVDGELLQFSWLWIVLQLGYFILLVLFLLPSTKTIGWRIVAIIYSVVQLSLAYFILRSSDLLIWSCLFCFVNLIHFIIRISKWRGHFSSDTEQVGIWFFEFEIEKLKSIMKLVL